MLNEYENYLINSGKSSNTVKSYVLHIKNYMTWIQDTYGQDMERLYRANVLDYIAYLKNIKKLTAQSINAKLSALISLNTFLMDSGIQSDMG